MKPEATEPWMRQALMHSVRDALELPWVMDIDATIKPLYGHQEGAEIGYNPHKPAHPSHLLHTFPGRQPAAGSGRAQPAKAGRPPETASISSARAVHGAWWCCAGASKTSLR